MSGFETFSRDAALFQGMAQGEAAEIRVKGALPDGAGVAVEGVIVLRGALQTRATDNQKRLEYAVEVHVPKAVYPDAGGVKGAGRPNPGGDVICVAVRQGDTVKTPKKISRLIGQVGGMWHLGLD